MKQTARLTTALVVLLALALPALAAPSHQSQASVALVRELMHLVRTNYRLVVPPPGLSNGAVAGLEQALKDKKIAHAPLTRAPKNATQQEAVRNFEAQFYALAAEHPELLKKHWLAYHAIRGMLKVLHNRYTVFLDPEQYKRLQEAMTGGNFGGLGIFVELDRGDHNRLTVLEPIPDTPAAAAGIKPGDVILKIDGKSTDGITIEQAQTRLRGRVGTKVVLTIRRLDEATPFDVTIVRDRIHVDSVSYRLIKADGRKIGYMHLHLFGADTNNELASALEALDHEGAQAYILDLRDNGGGYIVAAVDVCSEFLPTGSLVVSVKERGHRTTRYRSLPNLRYAEKPLVVLVNQYSASASEITAACLEQHHRAVLVGVKTFGKGSVQKIFPVSNGSALKVTTAHYHTPDGDDINKVGIQPNIKVAMPVRVIGTPKDVQFHAAVAEVLRLLGNSPAQATGPRLEPDGAVRVSSVQQELEYLRQRGTPDVVDRHLVKRNGRLLEELRVRRPDGQGTEKVLLDISPFLGE